MKGKIPLRSYRNPLKVAQMLCNLATLGHLLINTRLRAGPMGYRRFTRTDGGGATSQAARRSATVVIKVMGSSGDSSSPRLR